MEKDGKKPKKKFEEINSIFEMVDFMKALQIPADGLTSLDEMKEKVNEILSSPNPQSMWSADKVFSVITNAKQEDAMKRKELQEYFADVGACIEKFSEGDLAVLDASVKNVKRKILEHQELLEPQQYFILVAGETSAGKSSFLNLLMGEELFPYSTLSTTSSICELKYGSDPKMVVHYKDDKIRKKTIPLNQNEEGKNYIEQLAPYVHKKEKRETGSEVSKVEVFWPNALLKTGVVVIDSPGVGESAIMDQIVQNYLPQAFAFIYIINSQNAGGVQHDRVGKLLEGVKAIASKREEKFPSKCALFVCNKWDLVPEHERENVKTHVTKSLNRCWANLDPDDQIAYLSTTEATKAQAHGVITAEFKSLKRKLKLLVLKSIDERIYTHLEWLIYVLSRVIFIAEGSIRNAARNSQEVAKKMKEVEARIQQIEAEKEGVIRGMHVFLNSKVSEAVRRLSEHLVSPETRYAFCTWSEDDVVEPAQSWDVTRFIIMKALENRLCNVVEDWEEENQVFTKTRAELVTVVQQRWNLLESQLEGLENIVIDDKQSAGQLLSECNDSNSLSTRKKLLIGVTSPIWVPLSVAAGVLGVPVLGIIAMKDRIGKDKKIKKYTKNKREFLSAVSTEYLNEMTTEARLTSFVSSKVEDAHLYVKKIEAHIPAIIDSDRKFMKQLQNEKRSVSEVRAFYSPIKMASQSILTKVSMFGINHVRPYDIGMNRLNWKKYRSICLEQGAFATVYRGRLKQGKENVDVALKVSADVINEQNVSLFLAEEDALRKLQHRNIVKFYGTAMMDEPSGKRSIFVMELCKTSLRSYISQNPRYVAGMEKLPLAIRRAVEWAKNITDPLCYMHGIGIIHRNLTLDNIMIKRNGTAKIADVGLTKPEGVITDTVVYMAPEVLQSEDYSAPADIYSLGMVLWEIWYGERVFKEIAGSLNRKEFLTILEQHIRPIPPKDCEEPIPVWDTIMKKCWKTQSGDRPSAAECCKLLKPICDQYGMP